MIDILLQLAPAVVAAILAITLHEAAHGYAALALGDDTARLAGRLSLNPLRHVDRVGTILLPGFLLIFQLLTFHRVMFMFGWAKPVPVSAWKFRDPRRGMAVVACAGPAMNFLLAYIGALLFPLPSGPVPPGIDPLDVAELALAQHPIIGPFLFYFILTNLVLGLFNLLPIPPLGRRPDRGRPAAAAPGAALGAARAGRHRAGGAAGVPAAAGVARVRHRFRSVPRHAGRGAALGVPRAVHSVRTRHRRGDGWVQHV